jgi:hypothetical protein
VFCREKWAMPRGSVGSPSIGLTVFWPHRGISELLARAYDSASELELPRREKRLPKHVLTISEAETVINQANPNEALRLRDRAILETFHARWKCSCSSRKNWWVQIRNRHLSYFLTQSTQPIAWKRVPPKQSSRPFRLCE